ncbi:basement membrane-specific heparan sulfate proteoglycan core protein-like [Crassostrea angulata]|uniref:basement membrane-specific heparan sulfate proteoglycan core protein-like n=1 Tax=Magallana angulata TaxID=2784310 RepID=UPI0022B196C3|nr:basement membrane-specific heparan sulfate proteoglycan core protein-like [Crassostrea angulata]
MPDAMNITWMFSTINSYSYYYYAALDLTSDVRYDGGTVSSPSLVIRNVTLSDGGYYLLGLTNVDGTIYSSRISLSVQKSYPNVVTTGFYAVNASNNVTLTCNFTSSYPPVQMMQWYRYDSDITTGLTGKYVGGTLQNPSLTITDFQPDDQGIYKCSASNLYGTRNSSDIIVYLDGGKQINVARSTYSVYTGDDVILSVSIFSMPDAMNITWMFSTINSYSYYYYAALDLTSDVRYDGGTVSSPSLVIRYPNVVTTGFYAVNASNNVTLTCNFTSSYPPVQMMQWYRYDSDITTGLTGKYVGGTLQNPSLTITDFQPDDQGIYKCSASNLYGTRNSSDIIVYLDGGAPVTLTGQNMTGSPGTTLTIPCTVVSESISTVFWTFQPSDQDNETEIVFSYSKFYWYSSSPSLRIYYLNTSDIGFYRCCANSSSGLGRSTPVHVTLKGKQINVARSTYSVYTGDDVILSVSIFSMPDAMNITWMFSTINSYSYYYYAALDLTSDVRYDGGTVSSPSLVIRNVTLSDGGYYLLGLTNVDGTIYSSRISLSVQKSYPNVVTTGFYAVNASNNVTLTCNFTSSYPPVQMMQWYRYDSDITTGLTGKYVGGTLQNPSLTITDFQPDDQGIYKCSASNLYGTRNSSDIIVYLDGGAPVTLTGQNMTGSPGTTLTIPCTVVSESISTVFWTFQPSDQDNETEIVFSYSKFYWYSSSPSLRIYYLNTSDIGFYRCCANSSSGLGRSTPVHVTLKGKQINVARSTYSVYTGDDVILSVSIFSMPDAMNITWMFSTINSYSYYYYAALDLTSDVRYDGGTVSSPSLVIRNVTLSDGGYYLLGLTNVDGTIYSSRISLSVQKSYPNVVTTGFYAVNASNNVTLTCNFTSSYPPVQMMQWYRYDSDITTGLTGKYVGGTLQNPSLTITDFQPDDQGIYKCSASNLYGTRNSSDIIVYLDGARQKLCSSNINRTKYDWLAWHNIDHSLYCCERINKYSLLDVSAQ